MLTFFVATGLHTISPASSLQLITALVFFLSDSTTMVSIIFTAEKTSDCVYHEMLLGNDYQWFCKAHKWTYA